MKLRALLEKKLPLSHPVWKAIGYKEALCFLQGKISKEESIKNIFQRSRQYAKRQKTWFRNQHNVHWVNFDKFSDIQEGVNDLKKIITSTQC